MRRRVIPWAYAAVVVAFLASLSQYHHARTGFTSLIWFGDRFEDALLPAVAEAPHFVHVDSTGYDGQFYAQLAVDPLLRDRRLERALDAAPYRARRILFCWTAHLAGLGRPAWVLQAYAVQNIVAWLLLAWVLARWLPPASPRNLLPWVGCLFGVGLIMSVRFALTEGPSVLLLALAVAAMERGRPWLASALMAFVGLGRETNFIAGGLLIDGAPGGDPGTRSLDAGRPGIAGAPTARWRRMTLQAARLLLAIAPFAAWIAYVRWVFPPLPVSDAANFAPPFSGYLSKWSATIAQLQSTGWWGSWARFNLAALVSLTVQAGFLLARREWGSPWWRAGAAYCVLLPFLSYPVWEGDPGAVMRVALPASIAFNVLVVRSRWFWPLAVAGNLSVFHGIHMLNVPWLATLL